MPLNDQIQNRFISHEVNLLRFQAAQRRTIFLTLTELESQLVKKLQANAGAETFTRARQTALLQSVRETIATSYKEILKEHKESILGAASFDVAHVQQLVNTTAGFNVMTVGVPASVLSSLVKDDVVLGAPLRSMWAQEATSLNQAFIGQMRQGIAAGETTDQLVQRVRGTKALNYKDGIMDVRRRGAEMRVRTAAQSVLNDARLEMYKANADVLKGWSVLAVLDDRTSDICIARSGSAWDTEGQPLNDETEEDFPGPPPWHPNCRSTLVPVVKSIGELIGDESIDQEVRDAADQLPAKTQASMDGQVAAKMNYEEWLKTKDEAFQLDVLGPGKFKLWQEGKISLKDLIDQRGNPLTLAQLKRKSGATM